MRTHILLALLAGGCGPAVSETDVAEPDDTDDTDLPEPDTDDPADTDDTDDTADTGDTDEPAPIGAGPTFRPVIVGGGDLLSTEAAAVNAKGQLAGTALVRSGDSVRISAFRFEEGEDPLVADHEGDGFATAIDADGTVGGWVRGVGEAQGLLFDGADATLLGHVDGMGTRVRAMAGGRVAGGCEDAGRSEQICTWSAEAGWTVGANGAAYGVSVEGDVVGITAVDGLAFTAGEDLEAVALWPGDGLGDSANAISPSGRFVVGKRFARMGVDVEPGVAWWVDRDTGERRELPDADGAPSRASKTEALGVNDAGVTVGVGTGADGQPIAWIHDPWAGRVWDLQDRLAEPLPDGMRLVSAKGIGGGYVAANASAADGSTVAVLLVPVDSASAEPSGAELPSLPESAPHYSVTTLGEEQSWAIGLGPDGVAYARFAHELFAGAVQLVVGRVVDGVVALSPAGDAVPARVGDDGLLIGHGLSNGFVDAFRIDGTGEHSFGRPEGSGAAFAYAATGEGVVVGECAAEGWRVCRRTEAGWEDLGPGRAMDAAGDVVVGGDDAGARLWTASGATQALPGRLATTISEDGRWIAGTGDAAWLLDRDNGVTWELPGVGVTPLDVGPDGVVVGEATGPRGEPRAFRYAPGDATLALLDLLVTSDLRLVSARDIAPDGRILADALDAGGLHHAVVLTPQP